MVYTFNIEEYLMSQTFKGNIVANKERVLLASIASLSLNDDLVLYEVLFYLQRNLK